MSRQRSLLPAEPRSHHAPAIESIEHFRLYVEEYRRGNFGEAGAALTELRKLGFKVILWQPPKRERAGR